MAILILLTQWNREANAQAVDEIFFLIAVEDESVNHLHRIAAGGEIETDDERQPGAIGCGGFVIAGDLNDGADGAGLLKRDGFDLAGEIFDFYRLFGFPIAAVLELADENAVLGHY